MKAKIIYSIDQEQFFAVHRVYLEKDFMQADKDLAMLKDVATTAEVMIEDVEVFGEDE